MDQVLGRKERLQNVCTHGSEHEADDIDDNDYDCREFDLYSLLKTYEQGHDHCQDCEKEFVINAGKSAGKCYNCVQNGKKMYDS